MQGRFQVIIKGFSNKFTAKSYRCQGRKLVHLPIIVAEAGGEGCRQGKYLTRLPHLRLPWDASGWGGVACPFTQKGGSGGGCASGRWVGGQSRLGGGAAWTLWPQKTGSGETSSSLPDPGAGYVRWGQVPCLGLSR